MFLSHHRPHRDYRRAKKVSDEYTEGRGRLDTLLDESSVFAVTTDKASTRVVLHFFHSDFRRCDIMDTHLRVDIVSSFYFTIQVEISV